MQVRCSHILVKDKALADRIYDELRHGARFDELARRYSTCPSKSKGGDLGFFGEGQMVKEFEREAFRLSYGAISRPVHTQFGWHIIIFFLMIRRPPRSTRTEPAPAIQDRAAGPPS